MTLAIVLLRLSSPYPDWPHRSPHPPFLDFPGDERPSRGEGDAQGGDLLAYLLTNVEDLVATTLGSDLAAHVALWGRTLEAVRQESASIPAGTGRC